MDISGAGALVAGGASGLGAATARALHEQGADLTIADVNDERGQALADELGARFVACDVRDEEQVAGRGRRRQGGRRRPEDLDLLRRHRLGAEGRGLQGPAPADALRDASSRINLIGTFNVLRLAATAMLENEPGEDGERGVCVNTASIAAYDGQIGQIAYSASKGGVVGMTLPAARDLAALGIRVVTIAPGLFDTPLLAALPEEARVALGKTMPFPQRLGRPRSTRRWRLHIVGNRMLNGEVIRLDGALRMAPR